MSFKRVSDRCENIWKQHFTWHERQLTWSSSWCCWDGIESGSAMGCWITACRSALGTYPPANAVQGPRSCRKGAWAIARTSDQWFPLGRTTLSSPRNQGAQYHQHQQLQHWAHPSLSLSFWCCYGMVQVMSNIPTIWWHWTTGFFIFFPLYCCFLALTVANTYSWLDNILGENRNKMY